MRNVLTIAGSDSCGGAGIQADLKTMCAFGVHGMSVITAVTVQNTKGVTGVLTVAPDIVAAQIDAVYGDIPTHAVKIGMVGDAANAGAIRAALARNRAPNIVLDPVMISKGGNALLGPDAEREVRALMPLCAVITPNIHEAGLLAGMRIASREDMAEAARRIQAFGARNVLVKSGAFQDENTADDLLLTEDGDVWIRGPRIRTANNNGSGCTLSAAIACCLARGEPLREAVASAKEYVTQAIRDSYNPGHGVGPLGHMAELYRRAGVNY